MKKSTVLAVAVLLTMTLAWAAFGQAQGGGKGKGRGGAGGGGGRGGMMGGPQMQKNVADLQEQVAKLKALVDAGAKAMEGKTYADLSEEDRAKMKERSTEQQKIIAAVGQAVDRLRMRQMAAEYNESITALGMTMDDLQKMGQRRGGRQQ